MNRASGAVLIALGLLILYMGITDKFKCFAAFWSCLTGETDCDCKQAGAATSTAPIDIWPKLPNIFPKL